jgi:alpha-D-ribose 1-methylphosphonate 5-triphosphate synthase subunit PhnG
MMHVDFREPSRRERLACSIWAALGAFPGGRLRALTCALACVFALGLESLRLASVLASARALDARRAALTLQARSVAQRAAGLRERLELLSAARRLRLSSADLAVEIATIGDRLGAAIALRALRTLDDGAQTGHIVIEGRGASLSEVAAAFDRLRTNGNLDVHRDEATSGFVSFELGITPATDGTRR